MSEQDPSSQEPAEEISQEASSEESSAAEIEETQQVEEPETRDEEWNVCEEVVMAEKRVLQAQAEAENFRKRMRRDLKIKFASPRFLLLRTFFS